MSDDESWSQGQIQGLHGKQILWHLVMLERGRRNKIGDRITLFFFLGDGSVIIKISVKGRVDLQRYKADTDTSFGYVELNLPWGSQVEVQLESK